MQIQIKNTIQMGNEVEIIREVHDCEWTKRGDYDYLIHENSQQEKVVLKVNDRELVMTRFSTPKSLMRFSKGKYDVASLPTPLGTQHLVTKTRRFSLDRSEGKIELTYDLLANQEVDEILASYDLQIVWG
ncbi:DUF1934 domain-containing protein [Streptococcus dentapri]|uniref:DUF1934 domain-containing protein n=1 Tax=Streptococcus dentapri TaxID=573564 RepID=A0ABV8D368_9STRE